VIIYIFSIKNDSINNIITVGSKISIVIYIANEVKVPRTVSDILNVIIVDELRKLDSYLKKEHLEVDRRSENIRIKSGTKGAGKC